MVNINTDWSGIHLFFCFNSKLMKILWWLMCLKVIIIVKKMQNYLSIVLKLKWIQYLINYKKFMLNLEI